MRGRHEGTEGRRHEGKDNTSCLGPFVPLCLRPSVPSPPYTACMQSLVPIAAIDAGSNGIRLIVGAIDAAGTVTESVSIREAVRLGADAFGAGALSETTIRAATDAFGRFADTMAAHGVKRYRAVATSATREATNGEALVERIRDATGIKLEIIDGLEEARLAFVGVSATIDLSGTNALMLDIGGGSLEVAAAIDGRAVGAESLPIGPVRLLERLKRERGGETDVPRYLEAYAGAVRHLIAAEFRGGPIDVCIGTGGNVVRMAELRIDALGKAEGGVVEPTDLDALIPTLLSMTPAERTARYGMRPDRADVIVPAMMLMRMAIAEAGVDRVLVPGTGLKEGLLREVVRCAK